MLLFDIFEYGLRTDYLFIMNTLLILNDDVLFDILFIELIFLL